ncbi:hypothetical protein V8F20_004991 [Naviculisporaceae sp. PSN 640]
MSNANALLLLADHIKLSLLERQRARTLNLASDSQDGHISRSLDQFRDGLEALQKDVVRLRQEGNETKATALSTQISSLQSQFDDLTSQFHGYASPATTATLTHPNDPSLAEDFAHAQSSSPRPSLDASNPSTSKPPAPPPNLNKPLPPNAGGGGGGGVSPSLKKSVRFSDSPLDLEAQTSHSRSRPNRLNNFPYRDDPQDEDSAGYRDAIANPTDQLGEQPDGSLSNVQIHEYHRRILEEQDAQLDALGASISRQRELSMQIGDELDSQVMMLDESERVADRHASRLDRAKRQVGRIMERGRGENKSMGIIIALIIILILLIVILK